MRGAQTLRKNLSFAGKGAPYMNRRSGTLRYGRVAAFPTRRGPQRQDGSEERDGERGGGESNQQHAVRWSNQRSAVKVAKNPRLSRERREGTWKRRHARAAARPREAQLFGSRRGDGGSSDSTAFGTFERSRFTSETVRMPRPAVRPTFVSVFGPKSARSTMATKSQ